jgi:threonyl-tRNA synthetase
MDTGSFSLHHYKVQNYSLYNFQLVLFMLDDAHMFCLEDQIKDEIRGVLDITEQILGQFGFQNYEINQSTRPEKSVGNDNIWEKATIALRKHWTIRVGIWEYKVDEGGGAFYGPKSENSYRLQFCA